MRNKNGFTLLELLVVVLIIGILAAIALPQYQKSVEKARLSEGIILSKAMKESVERYFLTGNNFDNMESTDFPTVLDIDLPEGEWVDGIYVTNNFSYQINSGEVLAYRNSDSSYYILQLFYESNIKNCYNGFSEMGTYICHYLESQGWEYGEGDI